MSTHQLTLPGSSFTLSTGTLTCFAFLLLAVLLVASRLNLALGAVNELAAQCATVSTSSDALEKLLIRVVVLFLALKLWPHLVCDLRGAFAVR